MTTGLSALQATIHLIITPLTIAAVAVRHHSALEEARHSAPAEAARLAVAAESRLPVPEEEDNV